MLTITIAKAELKKAFSCGVADYSEELSAGGELPADPDTVLLKIMLENRDPTNNPEEAA